MIANRYNFSAGGKLLETYKDCYCVKFEYEQEREAKDFFYKVSDFLLCLDKCNNALLAPFGVEIDLQTEIEYLEFGSLRSWLKDTIEEIKDEKIKQYCNNPKEAFGDLLVKVKHLALKFLSDKKQEKFLKEYKKAIETSLLGSCGYTIKETQILQTLSNLSKSSIEFATPPNIFFEGVEYTIKEIYEYKALENATEQISTTKGVFTIKKPDLAGNSQWEIISDKVIKVKVEDRSFLEKLKNREILIGYGERIEATIITKTFIDRDSFEVLESEYVLQNIRVLPQTQREQKKLL
ncbi:hypothetical protein [uncultured Helicobacter sp.]|uniref:hypothetical protein n=1 Tax=uncultured Helicobacter sp. TaxID=175537 RepID=UPI00374EE9EE